MREYSSRTRTHDTKEVRDDGREKINNKKMYKKKKIVGGCLDTLFCSFWSTLKSKKRACVW
jgi:hypothetical protein